MSQADTREQEQTTAAAIEIPPKELPYNYYSFDLYLSKMTNSSQDDQEHAIDLPQIYNEGPELAQLIFSRSELEQLRSNKEFVHSFRE